MALTTTVQTREGRRFRAPVANLTPNTLFVRTAQPLGFREVMRIELLGHTVRAVVIFACGAPRGAVLWFECPAALRAAVREVMPKVPVESPPRVDAESWREITNVEGNAESPPAAPFDTTDSSSASEALEAPWSETSSVASDERFDGEDTGPLELEPADLGPERPAPAPAASPPEEPAAEPASATPGGSTLPLIARDGCTVRFDDLEAYREQYASHLAHGGLVARAEPMPVGTQRMLVLSVPGSKDYTVSARVVFNQPGVVGFMLDSIGLHRERLKAMLG